MRWQLLYVRVAVAATLLLYAMPAHGDGGVVQLQQADGPFVITVFSAPTPLRAGAADFSVLVQRRDGDDPVLDADVTLVLTHEASAAVLECPATRQQATNKLLYAAVVDLPAPGSWDVRVLAQREHETARVGGKILAAAALPPLAAQWPYLAFPPLAIALFAAHQRLRSRSSKAS